MEWIAIKMLCEGYFMITSILYTARSMARKQGILIYRVLWKQRQHRHHHRHLQWRRTISHHVGEKTIFYFYPTTPPPPEDGSAAGSIYAGLPMSITIQTANKSRYHQWAGPFQFHPPGDFRLRMGSQASFIVMVGDLQRSQVCL